MNYLFSLLFLITTPAAHEFHISTTTIHYDDKTGAFQIVLHTFIDDLEEALRQRGHDKLFLGTELETKPAEGALREYISESLQLRAGDSDLPYDWVGRETTHDLSALYIYLEIPETSLPPELTIRNRLLTEVYDDQQNIIHVTGPGGLKGYLLLRRNRDSQTVEL